MKSPLNSVEQMHADQKEIENQNESIVDYLASDKNTLDEHRGSQIAAFYEGRSIFITGASGFVGKVSESFARFRNTGTNSGPM